MSLLARVASAPAAEFWWGLLVLLGAVFAASWQTLRKLGHKRLMEDTPTSLIRSAAQGYVELQGHAALLAGDPIIASLSRQQCVWYAYHIERKERATNQRGQTVTRWQTIERGVSEELFALVDPTGQCVIDPDGAQVTASYRNCWYGQSPQPPRMAEPAAWSAWLGLAGLGRTHRYTEERIAIGSPLYALGLFRSHAGARPISNAEEIAALLREWKRDQRTLKARFDENHDGAIDAAEWAAARRAAEQDVMRTPSTSNLPPAVDTLVDPGDSLRPYILSATTEQALTTRANRQIVMWGLCAFAGATLALWALVARL